MKAKELIIGYKYIPGYYGLYSINENGDVFSHYSQKILKPNANHRGYLMVDLYKNGKVRKGIIHRLVAITFIPNPFNLPEVDHIDTNRKNNNVSNLRWCTRKDNCNNPISLKHAGESRKGERHYLFGKSLPKSTKEKMSASLLGHTVSEKTRCKIGNANKGHIMSEKQKLQLSESRKGKQMGKDNPNSRQVIQYDKKGTLLKIWHCISDASRELGVSVSSICNCLNGLSKTAGGFVWKS
jgi:hypothetical protein